MAYAPPLYTTEFSAVSRHNKADLLAENPKYAYAVTENSENGPLRDLLTILKDDSAKGRESLKDLFQSMANVQDDGKGAFAILHAVRAGDPVNNVNAKLPTLHAHVFGTGFNEDYAHITDPQKKTYVARPNADIAKAIKSRTDQNSSTFQITTLDKKDAEAKSHDILSHGGFSSLRDFANNANDAQWDSFAQTLALMVEPTMQDGKGGSRIIIDDRHFATGTFIVQVLSGEKLHSSADKNAKWFDKGSPELNI